MAVQFFRSGLRALAERRQRQTGPKDTGPANAGPAPRLYVFGSSSSEVFDCIFGASRRYRSYWAQLLNRINQLISGVCDRRDLTPVLGDEHGVLKREYHRDKPNHHADYVRIQELVWDGIRDIPGLPPRRADWRTALYKSGARGGVGKKIRAENYRAANLKRFEPAAALPREKAQAADA
ncbi:hypothetical protein K3555_21585 (plasmid) [Leisingera sp. M527]|uniref:hypothetical protein n=1 Tax=Leisingera sp. M527 TaxID=2867014 RepID=UPI0021A6E0EB|nr:hypothetical protein [Leisingera sp. M527]UWQ35156.1 hypothetical protein K3555_21585 [Leisingera sp. M527]